VMRGLPRKSVGARRERGHSVGGVEPCRSDVGNWHEAVYSKMSAFTDRSWTLRGRTEDIAKATFMTHGLIRRDEISCGRFAQ
jgi:hypothetical protein